MILILKGSLLDVFLSRSALKGQIQVEYTGKDSLLVEGFSCYGNPGFNVLMMKTYSSPSQGHLHISHVDFFLRRHNLPW
jgi:hypothetical protein